MLLFCEGALELHCLTISKLPFFCPLLTAHCIHTDILRILLFYSQHSFDGATYLFAFLNVTTTNLYASARAKSGATSANAESVVRTSAKVALRSGLGLMVFLLVCSRPLLKLRSRAYIIQIDCTIL